MPSTLYSLLAFVAAASAAPGLGDVVGKLLGAPAILEQIVAPESWHSIGKPSPKSTIQLQIGLKQNNIEGLHAKLNEISDHESPSYGKWLSPEEVEAFTAPAHGVVDKVLHWLKTAGVSSSVISQPSPDWINLELPLDRVEELIGAQYNLFRNDITGNVIARTLEYTVPKSLHALIDTIQPTVSFVTSRATQHMGEPPVATTSIGSAEAVNASCAKHANPDCIRKLYNVDYKGTGRTSLAAVCYNNDDAYHKDIHTFLERYDPSTPNATDYADIFSGNVTKPEVDNFEPTLDIQMQVSLGYPNKAALIHTSPPSHFYEELLSLTNYLNTNSSAPHVISMSYDSSEPSTSNSYTTRICNEFSKVTSRGITVLVSSGDYGVGSANTDCDSKFAPTFPSGCPYITSVGATSLSSDGETETAAKFRFIEGGTSAGGFSNIFDVPDWQKDDTSAYIGNYTPAAYDGKYNKKGRGYPDISLLGTNISIVYNSTNYLSEGTSASTPMLAGLLSQINDYRLANGKPLLGFINKRLYTDKTVRAALRDVTTGNNPNCGTQGFNASSGWDPVTGLGSIDFAALRKAFDN